MAVPARVKSVVAHRNQATAASGTSSTVLIDNDNPRNNSARHYLPFDLAVTEWVDASSITRAASPNSATLPDGLNVYFGDLHSHTGYSDGKGTPAQALQMARANGLDFFSITDHAFMLSDAEWNEIQSLSKEATVDGEFIAFPGYEWTSNNGHIDVFNTSTLVKANDRDYDSVEELYAWLSDPAQINTLAQFNHPFYPPYSFNSLEYDPLADRHVFMIEMHDGDALRVDKLHEALTAGWRVAVTSNSDTHQANWGERRGRNGIVVRELTYHHILNALRARRTFATQDENLVLTLRADDYWMGSIVRDGPVQFEVYAFDPEPGDLFSTLELYENGVLVRSIEPNASSFTWIFSQPARHPPGTSWYVKATQQDGDQAYTSPIWTHRPNPHDVMIRDNMWDIGDLPSVGPSWQSPDIWIRRQADGQIWHENPAAGVTNYVYARVHNIGLNPLTDVDAYVYWTLPSLGMAWPGSWHPINPTPVRVPNLAPGETTIVEVPWNVPTTTPDNVSLFVRLVSAQDPVTFEGNAKWDNNLAWKNVRIVGIPSGPPPPDDTFTEDLVFYITNPYAEDKTADIRFVSNEFPAEGSLRLRLAGDLFDRWMATEMGGAVKGGVAYPNARVIAITAPDDAAVYGLPLRAEESSAATLELSAPIDSTLSVHVSENIDEEEIGGNLFATSSSRKPSRIQVHAAADRVLIDRSVELTAAVVGDGFIPAPDGTQVQWSTTLGSLSTTQTETQSGTTTVTLHASRTTGPAIVEASVDGTVAGRVVVDIYRDCWARLNETATDYYTVQEAVDASSHPSDLIKVAGHCITTNDRGGLAQVVYINKTLTVRGGYTTTNWAESNPLTYPTTLDAQGAGRVLYIASGASPRIEHFRITGGDATGLGGGLSGEDAGGGVYALDAAATLGQNWLVGNAAEIGSGVYLSSSDATLVNNVIADNGATDSSSGVFVAGSSPRLLHNTIARNGTGVHITNAGTNYASVALTNTILVSHDVGLLVAAGNTAVLESTLWGAAEWANDTDWSGDGTINTGTNNIRDDPDFTCLRRRLECAGGPVEGDYHLGPNSAALDAGVDAGVVNDIDGDPRSDGQPDLGADEPLAALTINKYADPVRPKAGGDLTYSILITNTGDVDLNANVVDTLPMHIVPGETADGQPVVPGGTLSWAPIITVPAGTWLQTFDVAVEPEYVGPLTNAVQATATKGATGNDSVTSATYLEQLAYFPTSVRNAYTRVCAPKLVSERETGPGPRQVALDTTGRRVFIAHADGVTVMDADSLAVITEITGLDNAHGIAYDPDNDHIWVTRNKADRVVVLDGTTYATVTDLATGDEPHSVAYNAANGRVYVSNYHGWTVSVYNAATLAKVKELTDFAEPAHIAVNNLTNKVYVANHRAGNHVTVIDGATHSTHRILTALIDAYGITVDTTRNLVYVTAIAHGRISIIDGATDTELGFLSIQRSSGKRVPLRVIAVNPNMGPEGHLLFVSSSEDGGRDQLLLIPNGWPTLGKPVPLTLAPYPLEGIVVDQSRDYVWVTNVGSGLVSVVQDSELVCPVAVAASAEGENAYYIRVSVNP
jgi:uncharacterized repeat protein (TIGR01451 family)